GTDPDLHNQDIQFWYDEPGKSVAHVDSLATY
ncbi:hypothetical protein J2T59_002032, partial [Methanosalsum natronophilum]|nr:hypothetical protein [Methanosalsum natronophilum]MCS3924938.1 hypothetical protein [Methanosalsum natronophilum]